MKMFRKNGVFMIYVGVIRNMYDGINISVRTVGGDTKKFVVNIRLY